MTVRADESGLLEARLASGVARRAVRPSAGALFAQAATLSQPVIDQSWQALAERASLCFGVGYAALRRLQGEAVQARLFHARQRPVAERFARLLQFVAQSARRAEFAQAMAETLERSDPLARLEALLANRPESVAPLSPEFLSRVRAAVTTRPDERIDIEDSLEKLSQGKTQDVSLLAPFSPRAGDALANEIEQTVPFALLCLCRGLLASVHAEFNLALQSVSRRTTLASDTADEIHDAADRVVGDAEDGLRQRQRSLYAALLAGQPGQDVADTAAALAGGIERMLPGFVRFQAALRLAMLELREQGKGTASERIGRVGVRAGALTRQALASHCAGYRLALSALGPQSAGDVADLVKKTNVLPFETPLPDGKNTTLAKLDASLEGVFVEIEGFVTAVKAERQGDGKLISHLALHDPSSGAAADVVAVFAHLLHAGVTRDAYCRLSGVFRNESVLFQGRPAVETDMLALGELSKASWQIAFLRLAEPWFQPWRNSMNLYWSLGPHGGSEDGEGLFGAGELLFTPLIRR